MTSISGKYMQYRQKDAEFKSTIKWERKGMNRETTTWNEDRSKKKSTEIMTNKGGNIRETFFRSILLVGPLFEFHKGYIYMYTYISQKKQNVTIM